MMMAGDRSTTTVPSNGEENPASPPVSPSPSTITVPVRGINPLQFHQPLTANPLLPPQLHLPLHSTQGTQALQLQAAIASRRLPCLQQQLQLARRTPAAQIQDLPSLSSMQHFTPHCEQLLNVSALQSQGIGTTPEDDPLSLGALQSQQGLGTTAEYPLSLAALIQSQGGRGAVEDPLSLIDLQSQQGRTILDPRLSSLIALQSQGGGTTVDPLSLAALVQSQCGLAAEDPLSLAALLPHGGGTVPVDPLSVSALQPQGGGRTVPVDPLSLAALRSQRYSRTVVDPLFLAALQSRGSYSPAFMSLHPGGLALEETPLHSTTTREVNTEAIVPTTTVSEPIVVRTGGSSPVLLQANTRGEETIFTEPIVVRQNGSKGSGKRQKRKSPDNTPMRPLSAYNYFFTDERDRILKEVENGHEPSSEDNGDNNDDAKKPRRVEDDEEESLESRKRRLINRHVNRDPCRKRPHRSSHGKISFVELSRMIGKRWRALTNDQKDFYREIANTDMRRYQSQLASSFQR